MPTWSEILEELNAQAAAAGGRFDFDGIRRKYLTQLHALTHRSTIIYYTNWMSGPRPNVSIDLGDMQGMMEVCKGLAGPDLDLIIHSPGGSAEAAASIVRYLRKKFRNVRVFVPLAAMSAATMIALSGDVIVMGNHSQLGPIDPQLPWPATGVQAPAGAIQEQFDRAKEEIQKDASVLGAWIPILQQYAPALLVQCAMADDLARRLVIEWLERYMLKGDANAKAKAEKIAAFFGDYKQHGSHSIGIDRDQARSVDVKVEDLETDAALQDAVLSVHHAALLTFGGGAVKMIENHLGKGFFQLQPAIQFQMPAPVMIPQPQPAQP